MQAVSDYKCTSLYGVPTMFIEYLKVYEADKAKYNISNLRKGKVVMLMKRHHGGNSLSEDFNGIGHKCVGDEGYCNLLWDDRNFAGFFLDLVNGHY